MQRLIRWVIGLVVLIGALQGTAQAQALQYGLISDNFQGQSGLPAGYVASGPSYLNFPDISATATSGLPRLKAFAATASNRNATETISTLNFTDTSTGGTPKGLCNGTSAAAACANGKGWMGRVMYALLKFPAAGTYYFTLAHDDGVQVDLSGQLTATDPRTATYGTVLGGAASYTTNDSTYETLNTAPFVVSASACYLMRVYWNNQGGVNHLRLRYGTQSNFSDQAIIPATQYLLPGVAANWNSCTNPTLTIKKQSVGGTGSFTFTGTNGYSGETITTTAVSTPVTGTTFSLTNQYAATSVTETGPSTFGLTSATCTDVNSAASGNPSTVPSTLSGKTVTIASTYIIPQAQIQCTLTNTKLDILSMSKASNGPWTAGQSGATYTLTASNTGASSIASPITIKDVLPSGITVTNGAVTLSGTNAANWSCTATSNVLTCTSNTALAANSTSVFTFGVTVGASAASTVTNYASIASGTGVTPPTPGPTCTTVGICASIDTTVLSKPTIAKAFSPSSILSTETSTITFALTNSNATPLTNLAFSDTLTNMSVNSTVIGGTCANNGIVSNSPALAVGATSLNLTVATLAGNSSCTVTVVIKPTTTGTLPNTAGGVKSIETPTTGTGSNTANLIVTTVTNADLSITKTGPSTAVTGTTISYLLTLRNAGPAPANNATFADLNTANLTGVTAVCQNPSAGVSGCSATVAGSGNVSGIVTAFPSGGSVQVLITGTIPAGTLTTTILNNTATIAVPSGITDSATANNTSATVTTTLSKVADLSITKTDGLTNVSTGQTVTYTIVVANAGPSTTTGNFTDNTPSGVTLSNWTCTATTGTANCPGVALPTSGGYTNTLLNLPTGSSITFQVTGTVTATSGSVSNTATIKAPNAVANAAGVTGATSSATDTDTILADLSVTKTGAAAAQPGNLVTYTLSVSNAGPSTATSITLTDSLPAGTSFSAADQASGFSGVYNGSTSPQTVTWTLSNMAAAAAPQTVTLVLRMPSASVVRGDPAGLPPTAGITSVTNSVTVSSPSDSVTTNNTATASTGLMMAELIKRVRNVTADNRDNGGTARFGTATQGNPAEKLEYCLTFRNLGGVALSNFVVTDDVPANVTALLDSYGLPEFGVSLLRGGTGTAGSPVVAGGTSALLTSTEVTPLLDGGSLSTGGGAFGQGLLTTTLTTPLTIGESGQTCFRASIR